MEHHHHSEAQQIFQVATSPEAQATIGRSMFTTMARVLRTAAAQFVPMNVKDFVVQPRMLKGGKCLALLNQAVPLQDFWTLLVMAPKDQPLTYQIYSAQDDDLTKALFAVLDPEDDVELRRQLATLNLEGLRLFTIVQVPQPIEGYAYFLTEQELKAQEVTRLEAAAAAARAALESASAGDQATTEAAVSKTDPANAELAGTLADSQPGENVGVSSANTDAPAE